MAQHKKVRSYASYFVDVVFKDEQKKKLLKVGKMFESCKKLLKDVLQAALTCSKTDPFLSPPSSPTQLTISTTFLHFSYTLITLVHCSDTLIFLLSYALTFFSFLQHYESHTHSWYTFPFLHPSSHLLLAEYH